MPYIALSSQKYISTWLLISALMVFLMVIIGGITRLTGSGLSMVEWRPLLGFLPPMSDLEWNRVFDLYKLSPEYIYKNHGIELHEFKRLLKSMTPVYGSGRRLHSKKPAIRIAFLPYLSITRK